MLLVRLCKRLRKMVTMAKRNKTKAKQMRSGTSPYVKYSKVPYRYSADYYDWKRNNMGGRGKADATVQKYQSRAGGDKRQMLMAAE